MKKSPRERFSRRQTGRTPGPDFLLTETFTLNLFADPVSTPENSGEKLTKLPPPEE